MAEVTIKSYRKERETEIMGKLEKAMENVGTLVETRAKGRADNPIGGQRHPYVRTGELFKNIKHTVTEEGNTITAHIGIAQYIGSNPVPSAPIIELGNSRQPPYPFLFPAVEVSRPDIIRMLARLK